MKHVALIVAGGSGKRMNAGIPKQFILLAGKPVLMHTLQRFFEADPDLKIIVVLPKEEIIVWEKLCDEFSFLINHEVVEGGETRYHSVKNGLKRIREKCIVAVHDGVRPFVSSSLINRCFLEAEKFGNAVPVVSLNESIRQVEGDQNKTADRSAFVAVQTPQCFDSDMLKDAYKTGHQIFFTDDASVAEFHGMKIHLSEGERENIKITYPFDLLIGEIILNEYFQRK